MTGLIIPTPVLQFKPVATGLAALEKPLEVRCAKVLLPDGAEFGQSNLGTAGFFVYRRRTATLYELWDEDAKEWKPDPGTAVANFKPKPLIFKQGDPFPWQAPLVAAGQKDKNDKDQFSKAKFGFPLYYFRAFFSATVNAVQISALSSPSSTVSFVSTMDAMRAGVAVGEDETPENASEITLFLRDPNLRAIGAVVIRQDASSALVEISNSSGGAQRAVIRLRANGDIELQPGSAGKITVNGPVMAEQIFYQPADPSGTATGAKKWLMT